MHAVRARALVPTRCASSRAPSSAVRRSRPARLATRARASPSDGDDDDVSSSKRPEDDDVPPPVQLTEDQARIAAIAFEVLYEKDAAESLEEMLVDKERPGLRFKLQQAIKGARKYLSSSWRSGSLSSFVLSLARSVASLGPSPTSPAHRPRVVTQPRTRRARAARPWSARSRGRKSTGSKTRRCARG
jgi:hypothetical protein